MIEFLVGAVIVTLIFAAWFVILLLVMAYAIERLK